MACDPGHFEAVTNRVKRIGVCRTVDKVTVGYSRILVRRLT